MAGDRGPRGSEPSGASPWRISPTEIATLAQVERAVPANWRRRHDDFPAPVEHVGGRTYFDGRAVVDWLLTTGRGNADENDLGTELALHTLTSWTARLPARDLLDVLTALLCVRHGKGGPLVLGGTSWEEVVESGRALDADDTCLMRELAAAGPWGLSLARLTDELAEAAANMRRRGDHLAAAHRAPVADAFEWLLGARRRFGLHELTADTLHGGMAECMARVTGIDGMADPVVANPDARSGDLLVALHAAAGRDSGWRFLASDPDPALARLVRRRMLVRGVTGAALDVQEGEGVADGRDGPHVVVSVIPYRGGEKRRPEEALERVEALTDLLADGCVAVVLGPADALTEQLSPHGEADRFRRTFLTDGLLKAAVALPGGALPYRPGYRTALWVLARTPERERRGRVLLADLSGADASGRTLAGLAADIRGWSAAGWDNDRPLALQHGVVVAVEELNGRAGAALSPGRRPSGAAVDRPARIADLELRLKDLGERTARDAASHGDLRVHAALRPDSRGPVPMTTIARLRSERRLRTLPGHRIATGDLAGAGDHVVLTPAEVLGTTAVGTHRIDRALLMTAYGHAAFTEPGDLVVTTQPRFGVYLDEDGFSVVAHPARVLRLRRGSGARARPRVLAALLGLAAADHGRGRGSVHTARTLERLEIPDVGTEEAERLEALLDEIERRSSILHRQAEALHDLGRLAAAGTADGTLALYTDR
ncbi:hypothetical protein ACFVFS_07505 [Kitasatospora sp. NPDC057692]|uniref:hypothetical protein n=1 Tax=Kitasatospora sp. NPDC057692 TaxID=3346215 RepID=UPI003689E3FE